MAGKVGMQKGGLSVHEPKRNAYVVVHAREKDEVGLAGGMSHPKFGCVTGQRQTYTYASEALTYRTSGITFPL